MDLIKLLQSIEELIYDLAVWVGFIPKTFVQVVTHPRWMRPYVTEELRKEPTERFKSYLSPLLFWVFVVVIPYALFFKFIVSGVGSFKSWNIEHFIPLVSIFLIGTPVTFSFLIKTARNERIGRAGLKPVFYVQCLSFAPLQLASLLVLISLTFPPQLVIIDIIFQGCYYGFLLWFVFAEVLICKQEFEMGWVRTVVLVLIFMLIIVSFLMFYLTLLAFLLMLLKEKEILFRLVYP